jgi:hypothetical protein
VDREDSGSFVLGAVILTIGAALLIDRLGIFSWTTQWSVWPLLLIAFGVVNLVESPWRGARGVFPIALGLWIWAAQAGWIAFRDSWPLLFVLLGVAVMWQAWGAPADQTPLVARRRQRSPLVALAIIATIFAATAIDAHHYIGRAQPAGVTETADRMHVVVVMGQAHRTAAANTAFKGGDTVTVMGETDIDLRDAVADGQDINIDVFTMMGQIVLRVPDGWTVDNRIVPVMGQIEDHRGLPDPPVRRNNRRRLDDNTWTDQGAQGSQGAQGTPSSQGPQNAQGSQAPATPGRIVLSGTVVMGNILIRS